MLIGEKRALRVRGGREMSDFDELVNDTYTYIENECKDNDYIEKYKKLGDNTNFFFKETMYKVK